ncbi:MAG: hypothetical protein ACYC5O_00290 [Anaerolineae bacterium]
MQMLWWMGEDYVGFIIESLREGLLKQDAASEMVALKCEDRPQFLTTVEKDTGTITRMSAIFRLQALVRDAAESHWRRRWNATSTSTGTNRSSLAKALWPLPAPRLYS